MTAANCSEFSTARDAQLLTLPLEAGRWDRGIESSDPEPVRGGVAASDPVQQADRPARGKDETGEDEDLPADGNIERH
jgi:hypothetical protein